MSRVAGTSRVVVVVLALLLSACARDPAPPSDPRDVIELRWVKAYPRESRADVQTGLLWGLSWLGAQLPRDAGVLTWHGDRVTLDLARARVLDGTQPAWRTLVAAMKASGEYRTHGALDAGRFIALTVGSVNHYYALTGANPSYSAARARYRFDDKSAAIVKSSVAHGGRRIDISAAGSFDQIAFVAFEGAGSFSDGSFEPHEMELLDMMPNGQPRFALYDLAGKLKHGATPELTAAGKPAKCMWCHETGLQPTFMEFDGVSGYYGRREFEALLATRRGLLDAYRERLDTQIVYRNRQDHAFAELLYITFEEPSRARLAGEWGLSVERVAELLRGRPTHAHPEFDFLGTELYRREDVESLAPYPVLAGPLSIREPLGHEPGIIGAGP